MAGDDLLARRHRVMGNAAPLFYAEPLELVRGQGVWLYDRAGRRYLDAYNNVPCVGHCHPRIVAALAGQAATLNIHTRYLSEPVVEYAERLCATFSDPLDAITFTCTGSEANELALRMARFASGHRGVIVSDYNYHGNSAHLAALATALSNAEPFPAYARALPIPCLYHSDGRAEALADRALAQLAAAIAELKAEGHGVAALLIDTFFANEGIPRLPDGYLARAVQLVHAAGGLVIVDEVQSGFARSGAHLWGYQAHPVQPDIVTLGKPMGNGFPLAGLVTRRELIEAFGGHNMYFNTFGGSPLAARVGQSVLDVIEDEDLQGNALRQGGRLRAGLERLAQRHPLIGDVRGSGLFFAVELVQDRVTRTPATAAARHVVEAMRRDGVLIGKIGKGDHILKIRPPLVFTAEHGKLLLETLDCALSAL